MCARILVVMMAGLGWNQVAWSQNANPVPEETAIQKTEDSFHRVTERMAEPTTRPSNDAAVDAQGIREALRGVTQAALARGGFDDLIDRFSSADRSRLGRNKQVIASHPILDGKIAQFQKDWQIRYNQEFKIIDKDAVYGAAFASIKQGLEPEGARLAGEKIQPNENPLTSPHDEIRDRNRQIATVTIVPSDRSPAIDVPMVLEPKGWKIDVPDAYSIQEMHDALLRQITDLDEHREQWPADLVEASRMVTRRILMAVLDIELPRGTKPPPSEPGQSPAEDRVLDPNVVR
jgi:hypothetical protein